MNKSAIVRYLFPSLVGIFCLVALSPAPLVGRGPGGKVPNNVTRDNEQTLKSQGQPVTMGQVGDVSQAKQVELGALGNPSQDGQDVLAAAAQNRDRIGSASANEEAKQVLGEAERRTEHPDGGHNVLWAVLVVGCIGGGIYGLKRWVDSNTPELIETTTKTTW